MHQKFNITWLNAKNNSTFHRTWSRNSVWRCLQNIWANPCKSHLSLVHNWKWLQIIQQIRCNTKSQKTTNFRARPHPTNVHYVDCSWSGGMNAFLVANRINDVTIQSADRLTDRLTHPVTYLLACSLTTYMLSNLFLTDRRTDWPTYCLRTYLPTYIFIAYLLTTAYLLTHLPTASLFTYLLTFWLACLLTCLLTWLLTYLITYLCLLTYSLACSHSHLRSHLLVYLFSY